LRTLLQTAEQLFVNAKAVVEKGDSPEASGSIFTTPECSFVLDRIASLNHQLGTSLRVCEAYVKYLSNVLQHGDILPAESPSRMLNFSDQVRFAFNL
jgi:hypothetical protein